MPLLDWHNKTHTLKAAATAPYRLLRHDAALSHGSAQSGNMLVQGDNLDALKVIMDEIFDHKNFVANCVWQKKYTTAGVSLGIPDSHDHLLVFKKAKKFTRNLLPRTKKTGCHVQI